jgi:hypothetical protein
LSDEEFMPQKTKDKLVGNGGVAGRRKTMRGSKTRSQSSLPEKFPRGIRLVRKGRVFSIELYFDKRQALEAGVNKRIAQTAFGGLKVATCYPSQIPPNLIGCKSRAAPDNCTGTCVLYADGEELGSGPHLFEKGVLYTCKCQ